MHWKFKKIHKDYQNFYESRHMFSNMDLGLYTGWYYQVFCKLSVVTNFWTWIWRKGYDSGKLIQFRLFKAYEISFLAQIYQYYWLQYVFYSIHIKMKCLKYRLSRMLSIEQKTILWYEQTIMIGEKFNFEPLKNIRILIEICILS